ncbi:MAG: HAD family hydrolase [Pseudomonadota bacterium]
MNSLPSLNDIDTLLLDMDGTLLDLRYDNHFWTEHLPLRISEIHSVPLSEATEHVHASLSEIEGTMNWYDVDHWAAHFEVDIVALKNETTDLIRFREGSLEFLEAIQSIAHLDVYIVTDAHPHVLDIKHQHLDILSHIPKAHSSHRYGYPKREAEFWNRFSEDVNLDRTKSLFIDDNIHVLAQAASHGIAHLALIEQPDSGHEREIKCDYVQINHLTALLGQS